MRFFSFVAVGIFTFFTGAVPNTIHAKVEKFEITSRTSFAEGTKFGDTGTYELLRGKVYFSLDPALRQNKQVVDLQSVSYTHLTLPTKA